MEIFDLERDVQPRSRLLVKGMHGLLVVLFFGMLGCDAELLEKPVSEQLDDELAVEIRERVTEFYEKARESGETVPDDVREWVEGDIDRMGTWEYKVLRVDGSDPEPLEEQLSELGKERWECSMTAYPKPQLTILCKRPARSYIKMLPFKDVLRLFPVGDGGGE